MIENNPFDIEEVSRNTGIGKDTLRVWERRYGFPIPHRGDNGERRYSVEQLDRLHKIQHLLDQGCRPGKVVGRTDDELKRLLQALRNTTETDIQLPIKELLTHIRGANPQLLRQHLDSCLAERGLERFVQDIIAPLVNAIGDAWAFEKLPIFAEHMASQTIQRVLTDAMSQLSEERVDTCAVLTTLPGERHLLGLLMAEAILASHQIKTINLGTETPLSELCHAAQHYSADLVVLSFSQIQSRSLVIESLKSLSVQLPANISLIIGGSSITQYRGFPGRVERYDLAGLALWCEKRRPRPPQ